MEDSMPKVRVTNKDVNINEQGYLLHLEDWSEAYVKKIAKQDNIELYNDHWEIIFYFREYFHENQITPTMHQMIVGLMSKNKINYIRINIFPDGGISRFRAMGRVI